MHRAIWAAVAMGCAAGAGAADRPDVLIITVDDMSANSLGAFGCELADTSPHIDRLAQRGVRFNHAHVVVANCMPSRNVMWSGLYPHNNRVEGFYEIPDAKHLHLVDLMKNAGYFVGIRGKVPHSTPYTPYAWDAILDTAPDGTKLHMKDAQSYGLSMAEGIRQARAAGKPFCLMMNISDPHKPFYAEGRNGQTIPDPHVPSRVFTPEEIPIPGFLFDDPVARKELSHYYSSVRRADDCAGEILATLRAEGDEANTLILFLSDHGMPLPFSKTQVYHDSTRTPLFFVWPGVLPEDKVDDRHMVSAVDLLPTLLDLLNIQHPGRMDGRSFAGLLSGGTDESRTWIGKQYHEHSGGNRSPMRAVETRESLYIFNPWSDGERIMATATMGTPTYRRMKELAPSDPALAARLAVINHRTVEEFYDVAADPSCTKNMVGASPAGLSKLGSLMDAWLAEVSDPILPAFRARSDAAAREAFMDEQFAGARARKEAGAGKRKGARGADPADGAAGPGRKMKGLIALKEPEILVAGSPVVVNLRHNLPENMGEQVLTVTLKTGAKRIDRKTVPAKGKGVARVEFELPPGIDTTVNFAAFVGEDFKQSPQHVTSKDLPVAEPHPQ